MPVPVVLFRNLDACYTVYPVHWQHACQIVLQRDLVLLPAVCHRLSDNPEQRAGA